MSIRVENDQIGSASSLATRVDQISVSTEGSAKSDSVARPGQDQVDVSAATEKISAELSAQNAARAAQVQQLGALYASGGYNVDSSQVGHSIVNNALGAAGINL